MLPACYSVVLGDDSIDMLMLVSVMNEKGVANGCSAMLKEPSEIIDDELNSALCGNDDA